MRQPDLHTHSVYSDGTLTPAELVQAAHQAGVTLLALTDHDSINGVEQAQQAAASLGPIRVIGGVELSTQWHPVSGKGGISIHIVGLNWQDVTPLQNLLTEQQQVRARRAAQICERLKRMTGQDFYPTVLAKAQGDAGAISRTHLGQALLEAGVVQRVQQAFDRYLGAGKPAHVPLTWASLETVLGVLKQAGATAVLAHPTRYGLTATRCRKLIQQFAALGGDAIELPAAQEPPGSRAMIDQEIQRAGLKVSIGSDFHGPHLPWCQLGRVPTLQPGQVGVWENW